MSTITISNVTKAFGDVVVLKEVGRAETVRLDLEGLRRFTEAAL